MKNYSWYTQSVKLQATDVDYLLEEKKLDITEAICEIMNQEGISRKQLAEKMNTSPAAITKFLNGESNFTLKTLVKFSVCLDKEFVCTFTEKKKRFDPYSFFSHVQSTQNMGKLFPAGGEPSGFLGTDQDQNNLQTTSLTCKNQDCAA